MAWYDVMTVPLKAVDSLNRKAIVYISCAHVGKYSVNEEMRATKTLHAFCYWRLSIHMISV